ncbi:MAG: ABC transporter ATP-binding protein [Gemmatimonadota bacterium]
MIDRGPSLEVHGIEKRFGAVRALAGARLEARPGEIHALLGENGAGKSTLVSMLAGLVRPDSGEIRLDSVPVRIDDPRSAAAHSIGVVHQHFKLVPALTALENVALGASVGLGWGPLPSSRIRARALEVARSTRLDVDLDARIQDLSVGARQRVEILKLLYLGPRLLILDEPTAVLSPGEVDALFSTLRASAAQGRTLILIAHKLDEVLSIADRVTVLRRGRTVLEAPRADVDARRLGEAMVGREPPRLRARASVQPGPRVARLEGVSVQRQGRSLLTDVDLEVHRGEVVAIAGVEGNGQRELALVLAGLLRPELGRVEVPEAPAYVPQERMGEALIPSFALTENVALALRSQAGFRGRATLHWDAIASRTEALLTEYDVRAPGVRARAETLSGGNQQKLVVGREVARGSSLFIAENPTRGLDVAATAFVQETLLKLRSAGVALVLISTDLDEVLALADRVYALVRGRLLHVPDQERTREGVGRHMLAGVT